MSLDARDVRILRSIAENDSTSPERIQEETNIPKSTVHYRIKNMKDRGVIKMIYLRSISKRLDWVSRLFPKCSPSSEKGIRKRLGRR